MKVKSTKDKGDTLRQWFRDKAENMNESKNSFGRRLHTLFMTEKNNST